MRTPCISIRGAYAYWICAGIKDVENRTRSIAPGWYGVHVSGEPEEHADLLPGQFEMLQDFKQALGGKEIKPSKFFDISEDRKLVLKSEFESIPKWMNERQEIRRDWSARKNNTNPYESHTIIGMMHIADCVLDSDSPWAEPGAKHWLVNKSYYFDKPIKHVAGKLGVWYFDIDDSLVKEK